jgi:hypothetical protein
MGLSKRPGPLLSVTSTANRFHRKPAAKGHGAHRDDRTSLSSLYRNLWRVSYSFSPLRVAYDCVPPKSVADTFFVLARGHVAQLAFRGNLSACLPHTGRQPRSDHDRRAAVYHVSLRSSNCQALFHAVTERARHVITRGFPIGNTVPPADLRDPDLEPHQRPMYFGHGDIDGIDFWGEAVFPRWSDDSIFGRTVLVKIEELRGGSEFGTVRALFHLVGPEGRVVADETQSFVFRGDPAPGSSIAHSPSPPTTAPQSSLAILRKERLRFGWLRRSMCRRDTWLTQTALWARKRSGAHAPTGWIITEKWVMKR